MPAPAALLSLPIRRRAAAVAGVAALTAAAVLFPQLGAGAGTATNTNSCDDSVTPGTYTDLDLTVTGTGAPNPAAVGVDSITLGGTEVETTVPSDLFLAGYRAFVLSVGTNTADATIDMTVEASNSSEGSQVVSGSVTGLTFDIVDPTPANRSSGDESATPLAVSVTFPDSTWTPVAGPTVAFRQTAADIFATVTSGPIDIPANFFCLPGTTDPSDDTIRTLNPNPTAFETVEVTGGGTTTTAPTTTTTSTTTTTTTTVPTTTTTLAPKPGEATNVNACFSNVTAAYTDISITMKGTPSVGQAEVGDTFDLTETSLSLDFPPDLFVSGYNLGLISDGDVVPGDVDVTISASNTSEGSFTYPTQSTTAPISITDPDGTRGTGDETAQPLSLAFDLPDTSWTATGTEISFTQTSAFIEASVGGGLIKATFDCEPGVSRDNNSDGDNETFDAATPTPFATVGDVTIPTTTTSTTVATTTTTAAPTTTTTVATTATTAAVLGTQQTRGTTSTRSGTLAFTGAWTIPTALAGFGIIDLGYLVWSATWRPRRRR